MLDSIKIDPRSLAAFRIAIGLILLLDLLVRVQSLEAHYTDQGAVPRELIELYHHETWRWSLHLISGTANGQAWLFGVSAVAAFCFTVGFFSRFASVCCWVLWASLQTRNPLVLNGGDVLLRMLLFWSMFLPIGQLVSVDRRLKFSTTPNAISAVASIGIKLQVCWMYWMAGYHKLVGGWFGGSALAEIMRFDTYARPAAHLLDGYPQLLGIGAIGTVLLELLGPFVLLLSGRFWKTRLAAVALFALLHLGIELTLTVGHFSYVSWAALLLFVPKECWKRPHLHLHPHPHQEKRLQPREADLPHASPKVRWWTASVRATLLCFLVTAIVVTGYNNFSAIRADRPPALNASLANKLSGLFAWHQRWNLFEKPPERDGWFVVLARLRDGRAIDLLRSGAEADWDSYSKPEYVARRYKDHRWRKLYRNLTTDRYASCRRPLCEYLARDWNRSQTEGRDAVEVELHFMEEIRYEDGSETYMQRSLEAVEVTAAGEPEETGGAH